MMTVVWPHPECQEMMVSGNDEEYLDTDVPLVGDDITKYRGVIARCYYLGTDRPDTLFAIKDGVER